MRAMHLPLHRWPIVSGTVLLFGTATSWLLAVALTQMVGGACLPLQQAAIVFGTDVASAAPLSSPTPAKNASAKTILRSNPFDSVTGPILDPEETPATSEGGVVQAPPSACASTMRLVVAAVDDADPERSLAVLSNGASGRPMVRTGSIVDGKRVLGIGAQRVYLREGEGYCWIGTTVAAPVVAKPKLDESKGVVIDTGIPKPINGIERIDDTHFAVDRLLRDKILDSPTEFMKTLQIAPEVQGGKTVGIKLLRVVPGSLFAVLGLKPADVVRTINGFEVGSPEKMLEAYAKLRTAPQLQVGIVRDGKPTTMEVEVR
jgi:general secretion pathway protein C